MSLFTYGVDVNQWKRGPTRGAFSYDIRSENEIKMTVARRRAEIFGRLGRWQDRQAAVAVYRRLKGPQPLHAPASPETKPIPVAESPPTDAEIPVASPPSPVLRRPVS